jgi:diadenosine tetraphosphate (Ap4A) HIT family hydrolase
MRKRVPVDHEAVRRRTAGRCFICEIVSRNPEYGHHVFFEDEFTIAFLSKYPTLYGYSLVAPREHREQVAADFTEDQYLALQRAVWRVGRAITQVVPTERLYVLSLGSQQANRHVHWHVVPLPPGLPLGEQQYAALDRADYLDVPELELTDLASRLRSLCSGPSYKAPES